MKIMQKLWELTYLIRRIYDMRKSQQTVPPFVKLCVCSHRILSYPAAISVQIFSFAFIYILDKIYSNDCGFITKLATAVAGLWQLVFERPLQQRLL